MKKLLLKKEHLKGIVKFGTFLLSKLAYRLDVSGIEYGLPLHDLFKKVEELHYSRLPVYKTSLDEVVGVLKQRPAGPFTAGRF
jgi:Mg2+/Co2+ transporter CorB